MSRYALSLRVGKGLVNSIKYGHSELLAQSSVKVQTK